MIESDLISGLIESPEKLADVLQYVDEDDFVDINCKNIFGMMKVIDNFDYRILTNKLREGGFKNAVDHLHKIIGTGFGNSVEIYAKELRNQSKKRKQIQIAQDLIGHVKTDMSADEIIELVGSKLMSLYDGSSHDYEHIRELIMKFMSDMIKMHELGSKVVGLSTGWKCLDEVVDGLKEGELIIIGARPSQGKTSIMTSIAYHNGVIDKKNVAIFSIESSSRTIIQKMVSQAGRIDSYKLRKMDFSKDDFEIFTLVNDQIGQSNMVINDDCNMNIYKMRSQLRKMKDNGFKPDLICVDYLQIIEVEKGEDSMAVRVGRVAQGLKNIAKELGCPVIALAQLNRSDQVGEPNLHSLKASGDIEQIADQVWLLHRFDFYDKNCKEEYRNKIQIDVAKNREGQTMPLMLNWEGKYTKATE